MRFRLQGLRCGEYSSALVLAACRALGFYVGLRTPTKG